ncbi:hypothetical protein TELCIR_16766 [Teladorsagia circumcincta]|uniref:Uncharacterized protein n=1 Tax=Teladorsagia circumcincta TaxID=45464 RepID=A0A2G9TUL0_TELCI|nr:hypothetical protein TELCIR_16766 [Teladorsagia circumcincta]
MNIGRVSSKWTISQFNMERISYFCKTRKISFAYG